MEGYTFTVITDHQALKWLLNHDTPSGRLARWVLELQQYEFTLEYRKGSMQHVPDALSRIAIPTGKEENEYLQEMPRAANQPIIDSSKPLINIP